MSRFLSCIALLLASVTGQIVWPSQSYVTESFKPPNVSVTQKAPTASGYLFWSLSGSGSSSQSPLIFTNDNELIWRGPSNNETYTDFHVQEYQNQPHLTYWNGNATNTFGHGYGAVHLINSSYAQVAKLCTPGLDIVTPGNETFPCYFDQHEATLTPEGTLLATAYNVTRADLRAVGGPKDGYIFNSIFYEIDVATDKVLFRWRSRDYPQKIPITESHYPLVLDGETYGSTGLLPWDYFHINSVQKLSDGYLVNSRHLFSTYKVSFNGTIEWHLSGNDGGDFTLGPGVYFSWQHRPRIQDQSSDSHMSITYFNNDNSEAQNGTNSTTGLALDLDIDKKTATLARKLLVPSELIFADSQGSYLPLANNHVLVGYGQIATTREFDANNALIYEAKYGYSNGTSPVASYRSYRCEWQGQPADPPKAAVKDGKIYVSWNGATEVASWVIYSGSSCSHLTTAEKAQEKTGFESSYSLSHVSPRFVLAEALDQKGKALANSSCISVT